MLSAIKLDGRDIGLGFFDALLEINEPILRERHLRPELMRSTLLRSVEGRFTPESTFFREAWRTERAHEEVPEIVRLADGDWLTHLLAQSTAWSSSGRCKMLRQLALYSIDIAVRQRCIAALCDGK